MWWEVVVHSGGHHVPSDKAMRLRYVEFMQTRVAAAAAAAVGEKAAPGGSDIDKNGEEEKRTTQQTVDADNGDR